MVDDVIMYNHVMFNDIMFFCPVVAETRWLIIAIAAGVAGFFLAVVCTASCMRGCARKRRPKVNIMRKSRKSDLKSDRKSDRKSKGRYHKGSG